MASTTNTRGTGAAEARLPNSSVIDLELSRIEHFLTRCGHPEVHLPSVVHIAGTNGKGSTLAFIRAGLEASGQRVHAYTSPHLVSLKESFVVASETIDQDELDALLLEVDAIQSKAAAPLTFFEATTAAALLAFARSPASHTLLEVGMGGRLDCTNVSLLRPAVCVITPVSLDHQGFLGNTIAKIAFEKAGILRAGVTAIIGLQEPEALRVIEARAAQVGATLSIAGRDWDICQLGNGLRFRDLRSNNKSNNKNQEELLLPLPSLIGAHQIQNAGIAIAVLRFLGVRDSETLGKALQQVVWPARLQRLTQGDLAETAHRHGMEILLDGGHNISAGAALAEALGGLPDAAQRPIVVVCGMLQGKDVEG
jgi:dihydrofolate synthase/folylpolyglutamate synthase